MVKRADSPYHDQSDRDLPQTRSLPSPDERPKADVVIYDGSCRLCTGLCHFLSRFDRGRLAYLSLNDQRVSERYPELPREELLEHVYVIDHRQRYHGGACAVRYLTRRLPVLWPFAPVLHIPGSLPLWKRGYRWVTKHRHALNRRD